MNRPIMRNELLRSLSLQDYDAICPFLERASLKTNRVLHHARTPMDYVYFPEDGLVSVLAEVGRSLTNHSAAPGRDVSHCHLLARLYWLIYDSSADSAGLSMMPVSAMAANMLAKTIVIIRRKGELPL